MLFRSAQVLLTGLVMGVVALWLFGQAWNSAIVLGLGLALSSTAFGLQSLAERKELNQPHGRLAFAILLFQDIAAIPLIAMVPLLAGSDHPTTEAQGLQHVLQILGSIAVVIIGGRLLPWLSIAAVLLIVSGVVWGLAFAPPTTCQRW